MLTMQGIIARETRETLATITQCGIVLVCRSLRCIRVAGRQELHNADVLPIRCRFRLVQRSRFTSIAMTRCACMTLYPPNKQRISNIREVLKYRHTATNSSSNAILKAKTMRRQLYDRMNNVGER